MHTADTAFHVIKIRLLVQIYALSLDIIGVGFWKYAWKF